MRSVAVIGAGPAGCFSGNLLSRRGFEVHIFEEHQSIGKPVQCTGIVTSSINELLKIPGHCIRHHVRAAHIISPKGYAAVVRFRRPDIILDREGFDRWMGEEATKAGAKMHTSHRFMGFDGRYCIFSAEKKVIRLKFDYIIGADGPLSQVAKSAGIFGKRRHFQGMQAIVRMKNDGCVKFFPHIGTIGWIVPESPRSVRIGVMARSGTKKVFWSFIGQQLGSDASSAIREMQGGLIPEYSPGVKTKIGNRIFLVGDAAGQVKATTGGGIIPGLTAAKALSRAIATGKDYEKEWKQEIGNDLRLHLLMRKALDRMGPEDYESMIRMFRRPGLRKALGEADRDEPVRLLFKCLIAEPRVLGLARHLF